MRNADQLHLCPSANPLRPVVGRCDVWSSGAYRYGQAIAQAALTAVENPDAGAQPGEA